MTSQINPNNVDGTYPVAGQPNNTQGFRDNFTNIKTNFSYAATEITDLENNGIFKSALSGTTLNNNMADNLIYAVKLQDVSYTFLQNAATSGSIAIDYSAGQYQYISTTGSISLNFSNFPVSGSAGIVQIAVNVTSTAHTLTLPAAVTLGITGIQGYSGGVITFAATGTYQFEFSTVDGGTTITIYDLNRPLNYYTNTVNVAATTASTSYTTGALIVAGGVGIGGNLYVNGDIYGNITIGDFATGNITAAGYVSAIGNITGANVLGGANVNATLHSGTTVSVSGTVTAASVVGGVITGSSASVTGNITGGNVLGGANVNATTHTGTTVSVSGNVTGGNINGFMHPSAGTTSVPSLQFTAGSVLNTPAAGVLEYDGTVFYATLKASQRGQLQSQFLRVQVLVNTLSDTTSAQQVFSTPGYVSLAASTTYQFEAVYYITRAAGTTSHTTSTLFNVSSALLNIAYTADVTTSTGVALTAVSRIYGTAATALVVTAASSSATENLVITLKGIMRTSAATDVTPQFQYSAAPGGAPTVLTNSYIKFIPLGTSSVISVGPWT